jgi:hypothetical protein
VPGLALVRPRYGYCMAGGNDQLWAEGAGGGGGLVNDDR